MSDMQALIEAAMGGDIGDELTDEDLVEFWRYFYGETNSDMARWWSDKPHQIAWRLLMRLVRAEHRDGGP